MKQVWKRFTYANVMSSLAVFLVLGGGAALAATQLPKNSVGTKQLKKNAVNTAKLKKNAVSTAKIRQGAVTKAKIQANAVTGAKVDESTLGTVPSATSAANALHAQEAVTAQTATNATNFSRYFNLGLTTASAGQTEVPLGQVGPFSFVGDCTDAGEGKTSAKAFVTSSVPGATTYAYNDAYDWGELAVGERSEIGYSSVKSSEPYGYFYGYYDDWAAATPDAAWMLEGSAKPMVNVFGADCAFLIYGYNNAPGAGA